jgi:hypothetical protein
MSDLAGRWIGRIEGTNSGNFLLDLTQAGDKVSGQARLNDAALGVCSFDVAGETADSHFVFAPPQQNLWGDSGSGSRPRL